MRLLLNSFRGERVREFNWWNSPEKWNNEEKKWGGEERRMKINIKFVIFLLFGGALSSVGAWSWALISYKEINSQSNAAKCNEIIREHSIDLLFVVVCGDQSARADFTRGISPIKIVKLPPEWRSQDANSWSCSWFVVAVAWNLRENRFIIIFIPSIARLAA